MVYRKHQILRLRKRLEEYRDNRSTAPPNALSLDAVLEAMRGCPLVSEDFFRNVTTKVLNERLRRFVRQGNTSSQTLEAIKQLLIFDDHLLEAELLAPEEGEMLAVYTYLASGTAAASKRFAYLASLKGDFQMTRSNDEAERVELEFDFDTKKELIYVTEFTRDAVKNGRAGKTGSKKDIRSVRVGYGILSTSRNLLHVYVGRDQPGSRVHYLELDVSTKAEHSPMLIRVGAEADGVWISQPEEELLSRFRVRRFVNKKADKEFRDINHLWSDDPGRYSSPLSGNVEVNLSLDSDADDELPPPVSVWSPVLIQHVISGSTHQARRAIENGADVNWRDENGMNALHHAAMLGRRPCVRMLVQTGLCNYLIPNSEGNYASDLALMWTDDVAVARLLSIKRRQQAFRESVPSRERVR